MDQRLSIVRSAPIDEEGEWEDAFWRLHLFVGIGSFTLGALLLLVYLRLTPHGPHRPLLAALALGSVVAWLGVFGPIGFRAIASSRRGSFFFIWSVTTLALIAACAALDGGEASPLSILLVLPVLFAGLVYPPTQVGALAVLALLLFVLVAATGGAVAARAVVTGVMLLLTGTISVTTAINREIKDDARRRLARRLHELATHDGLTGCLTYHAFNDALEKEANRAGRQGHVFSLVMADLDGFKAINDLHGHGVGDATLTSIANVMLVGVRTSDVVGRLGGDEFAILLPDTPTDQARTMVERIRSLTHSAVTPQPVTVSFGVSSWQGNTDSPAELLRRADSALYEAKRHGRNRVVIFGSPDVPVLLLGPTRA